LDRFGHHNAHRLHESRRTAVLGFDDTLELFSADALHLSVLSNDPDHILDQRACSHRSRDWHISRQRNLNHPFIVRDIVDAVETCGPILKQAGRQRRPVPESLGMA
jgi:hypothetical protein